MLISVFAASFIAGPCSLGDATTTTELVPKAYRNWSFELPADPFKAVSGSIPIAHAGGDGFAVEARGVGFAIDTDGDGTLERVVEGREHPETKVRHARVVLSGKTKAGEAFTYPVRLKAEGGGWKWAAGGALLGELGGAPIAIIDMDGNGQHGDVGTDAIVVGSGKVAQFLGETISIDGNLHALQIESGTAQLVAFEGKAGTLDVLGDFSGKGVMMGAVVQSTDGRHSFELSEAKDGMTVPAGSYKLVSASLGLGDSRVTADTSEMAILDVDAGEACELNWGAPIRATFDYKRDGGEIVLDPNDVQYVGAAGERWLGWDPIGKSPLFEIKEKATGDVLVDVVFPGSC